MRIEDKRDARGGTPTPAAKQAHGRGQDGRARRNANRRQSKRSEGKEAISARAVLTSSRNRQSGRTGERTAGHDRPRTHTYDIMATTQSRINRTSHEKSDRATRREGTERHGYNGASNQHAEMIDRKPTSPSASDGWRETPRGKQARRNETGGSEIRTRNDSTPQPQRIRHPPRPSCRKTGREAKNRPDRRDDRRGERRDEPTGGKQGHRNTPHTDKMRTPSPPPAAETTGKQTEGTPRPPKSGMSRLSTSAQTAGQEPSKQDTDTPRLTPRQPCRRTGRRGAR